jgi:hypothetical protein
MVSAEPAGSLLMDGKEANVVLAKGNFAYDAKTETYMVPAFSAIQYTMYFTLTKLNYLFEFDKCVIHYTLGGPR